MTTPRVTIEELTLDRAPTADFELLAHRTSDQREVRITLASALALVSVMTGGIGWTISANAPANPTLGQGWFDSSNGQFRIWNGLWELIGPIQTGGFNDAEARRLANQALARIATLEANSRTDAQVTALARAVAQAAAGGTQTGITMAWDAATNTYTLTVGTTPPPPASTVNVTFGTTATSGGAPSPANQFVATVGRQSALTLPAPTATGQYWVMIIPTGYRFASIRSAEFPNTELRDDWLATADSLRAELGPSRPGVGQLHMLITVEEVV